MIYFVIVLAKKLLIAIIVFQFPIPRQQQSSQQLTVELTKVVSSQS